MKFFILVTLSALFSLAAMADSVATLTCVGKKVVLTERSPYLGENSPQAQSLFVLTEASRSEVQNAAYFLDTETDIGRFGMLLIDGRNSVGGKFSLVLAPFTDESDETVLRQTTTGTITYRHGPLKGSDQVTCVRE